MGCSKCDIQGHLLQWYAIVRRVDDVDEFDNGVKMLLPIDDEYSFNVDIVRETITNLGYTSYLYPNNPNRFHIQLVTDVPLYIYEKNKRLVLSMKKRFEASNQFNQTFGEYLRAIDNAFNDV